MDSREKGRGSTKMISHLQNSTIEDLKSVMSSMRRGSETGTVSEMGKARKMIAKTTRTTVPVIGVGERMRTMV